MGHVVNQLVAAVIAQRGHLFPWAPVCLAVGIGVFFSLRVEPPLMVLAALGTFGIGALLAVRMGAVAGPLIVAIGLVALGCAMAGARTHMVAGPILDFRYYGAIEGRVIKIDRSASDAVRLTLDRVVLERMDPDETPRRVRVSLHGDQRYFSPEPGALIILTGHLSAPGGAVEPGGFDFRRHAWFLQLGAIGYTRLPVLLLEPAQAGMPLFKARMWVSARVQRLMPGETGAFAAAIMTGDRSGMGQDTLQALRDTNLAHLLAISGLHMGLLAGFVFAALRLTLLVLPWTRHRWPVKKIAAFGALIAAAGYLALSGGNVATERAFIMAAAALTALIVDRRALSLRSVATAALIVLALRPEALLSPGFQMSFAATTALVAVFEMISQRKSDRKAPAWLGAVLSVVVSSAVAGAATAPVGMAHFNQIAHYGLIANVISVPVMGVLVVPLGVVTALLMPFGLDWIGLSVMGIGLDWILYVANTVQNWSGAVSPIKAPDPYVLPILAIGGLILCLWRGRGRWVGLAPAALAVALWAGTERPMILIAESGTLVGVMTDQGRALSRAKGSGFVAGTWLENDGWGGSQPEAAARWPSPVKDRIAQADLDSFSLIHVQGKVAARTVTSCDPGQLIVSSVPLEVDGGCNVFDITRLGTTGSVAMWATPDGIRLVTDADLSGHRLWHGPSDESLKVAAQ